MKKSDAAPDRAASALISKRIADLVEEAAFKALVRQAVALNTSGKATRPEYFTIYIFTARVIRADHA